MVPKNQTNDPENSRNFLRNLVKEMELSEDEMIVEWIKLRKGE